MKNNKVTSSYVGSTFSVFAPTCLTLINFKLFVFRKCLIYYKQSTIAAELCTWELLLLCVPNGELQTVYQILVSQFANKDMWHLVLRMHSSREMIHVCIIRLRINIIVHDQIICSNKAFQ